MELNNPPFTFSELRNRFIVIGFNTLAYMIGSTVSYLQQFKKKEIKTVIWCDNFMGSSLCPTCDQRFSISLPRAGVLSGPQSAHCRTGRRSVPTPNQRTVEPEGHISPRAPAAASQAVAIYLPHARLGQPPPLLRVSPCLARIIGADPPSIGSC